jgi:hypothetical protein
MNQVNPKLQLPIEAYPECKQAVKDAVEQMCKDAAEQTPSSEPSSLLMQVESMCAKNPDAKEMLAQIVLFFEGNCSH